MFVLRYLYILALGVWLGGMAVAGLVAAPTIFSVLEAWNPVEGRVLAGQVFGAILAKLHLIFYGAALVMLFTLTIRRLLGPKPVAYGIRASIIVLMFVLVLASGLGISPRVEAMQREIGGFGGCPPLNRPSPDLVLPVARHLEPALERHRGRRPAARILGVAGVRAVLSLESWGLGLGAWARYLKPLIPGSLVPSSLIS